MKKSKYLGRNQHTQDYLVGLFVKKVCYVEAMPRVEGSKHGLLSSFCRRSDSFEDTVAGDQCDPKRKRLLGRTIEVKTPAPPQEGKAGAAVEGGSGDLSFSKEEC